MRNHPTSLNVKLEVACLVIHKIFYGSTEGAILYEHHKKLLELESEDPFVIFGFVDTTGGMGVLTQKCNLVDHEATYCTKHSIYLTFGGQ